MEWQKEKHDLEAKLQAQANLIEKIQADLQAKVNRSKDLEDQLAQAIELAHSRDARHEEMLQKFEMLMRLHTDGNDRQPPQGRPPDDSDDPFPTTPDRPQPTGPPPTKKPNQNPSPQRNIYSIFRQQSSRHSSPRNRKTSGSLLTQPMDTDETHRQLPLGAQPGKKQE